MKTETFRIVLKVSLGYALLTASLAGQPYQPRFGLHTDPGMLFAYTDTTTGFVQECAANGYHSIMYMVFGGPRDGSMDYFFTSPTLDTLGFNFVADHVAPLVAEASARGIEVYADIQGLAYVGLRPGEYPAVSPFGWDHVAAVVRELAAYGIDGVSEEMFLADWYLPTYQACLDSGITYIHKAISWDFGAMSHTFGTSVFDVYPHCSLIMTEDYEMNAEPAMIAGLEQMPAITRWLNKEYQIKVSADDWALQTITRAENLAMLKTVQFKPSYIYLMTWSRDHLTEFDLDAMAHVASEYADREEDKPLCNIVLLFNEGEPPDTWDMWEFPIDLAAATTGVKASGYRIMTTPEPVAEADMYYLFTRGIWEEPPLDLPDTVLQLFDSGKPVFLQTTHRIPNGTPNWNAFRALFGMDNNDYPEITNSEGILYGTYNDVSYAHARLDWEGNASSVLDLRPDNITDSTMVLATGTIGDTTLALILSNGSSYYINGNSLDLEASFPISHLLNNGLQRPTTCAMSAGSTSVFFALDTDENQPDTTVLHIRLPDTSQTMLRWYRRDPKGVAHTGQIAYDHDSGYRDTLVEGTLLIVQSEPVVIGIREGNAPREYTLNCYPNPFNPATTIHYYLPHSGEASLIVYDLLGREMARLVDGTMEPGYHEVQWDGRGSASGIYLVRLTAAGYSASRKMLLLK